MLVLYRLKVHHDGHATSSPELSVWDVDALRFHFPDEAFWGENEALIDNVYHLNRRVAEHFYKSLATHHLDEDSKRTVVSRNNVNGNFVVSGDFDGVFRKLMTFLEEELGFVVTDFLPKFKLPVSQWSRLRFENMVRQHGFALINEAAISGMAMMQNPIYRAMAYEFDIMSYAMNTEVHGPFCIKDALRLAEFKFGNEFEQTEYLRAYIHVFNWVESFDTESSLTLKQK